MPIESTLLTGEPSPHSRLSWQQLAWLFYGDPDTDLLAFRSDQGAVGEVRYVLGWIAFQVGRVGWRVELDDTVLDEEQSQELLSTVENQAMSATIATNLCVAGELLYLALPREKVDEILGDREQKNTAGIDLPGDGESVWLPVSTIDPNKRKLKQASELLVRGLWAHPARVTSPDPPLRGVLDVLLQISQLQDVAWAQNQSRIAQTGILEIANELDLTGRLAGGEFGTTIEEIINAPLKDPRNTGASPILLRAPAELMEKQITSRWVAPPRDPFDGGLEGRMKFLIQRLAWGFPVPPEILLGMTATNRATAFQIEDTTYRSHIEPIAKLVGAVYASALRLLLPGSLTESTRVRVLPDPTDLLARKHSVQDTFAAYDRGLIKGEYVLEVLGIDEDQMAGPEDIERIQLVRRQAAGERTDDPATGAEREGVQAALRLPAVLEQAPVETRVALAAAARDDVIDLDSVTAQLADLDEQLRESLRSATEIAVRETVRRIGARARSLAERNGQQTDLRDITNSQVPSALGMGKLEELEVNPSVIAMNSLESLSEWWRDVRLPQAQSALVGILERFRIDFDEREVERDFEASAELLLTATVTWTMENLDHWPLRRFSTDDVREVIAVAGGSRG